ncbi:MAG: RNA-binding S4 domain-containing protein [Bacteroidales bacterium]|nr:RNA-binding S4 domain-containing protein [Bacteroidales bacterium]MDD4257039.1 RNA-binding S4 domain-containing protein [Bacteroidales bacterium]MDD4828321.1 RNA-binding S4 domain-containing protein [Bacteroidales bacterium]
MEIMRLDKYLWAIRVFKTRSEATEACRGSRVKVNEQEIKPSRELREGDVITVRKGPIFYTYRVIQQVENRQPAKNVPLYAEDLTPAEEYAKLEQPRETITIYRKKGTGRPTKKERRQLDDLMDH